jgi:uncharacterized protein YhfF
MIFRQWQQVLDGTKTQTRRQVKPGEEYNYRPLFSRHGKWIVGRTYAVQPGSGRPAVGRIRITNIRQERLQDISEDDVLAEGVGLQAWARAFSWPRIDHWPRTAGYAQLWNSIYTKPGTRWQDNPLVWVLEFELVEGHAR